MALKFYGCSDDLVEVRGHFSEEYNEYGEDGATFVLADPEGGSMFVTMAYSDTNGTWIGRCSMTDEGVVIPWPVTISTDLAVCKYSVIVDIDCPDNVTVTRVGKDTDDDADDDS